MTYEVTYLNEKITGAMASVYSPNYYTETYDGKWNLLIKRLLSGMMMD